MFEGTSSSQELRNCHVRGNFVLAGGAARPREQSAGLLIRGPAAPRLQDTTVIFQVIGGLRGRAVHDMPSHLR